MLNGGSLSRVAGEMEVRLLSSSGTGRAHNANGVIRRLSRAAVIRPTPGLAPGSAASFVVRDTASGYSPYAPVVPAPVGRITPTALSADTATSATADNRTRLFALRPGGPDSGNYDLSYQGNNLTITKALLNVIADAKTKVYGDADPSLTYQVSGLKNGDTLVLASAITFSSALVMVRLLPW